MLADKEASGMGGKVKGRRMLIVLSRDEERIVKAAAEATGEPRATFIRRSAVAQALESALAIDDALHYTDRPDELSDEEVWLHNIGGTLLRYHPKWIQYLRMYTWPQVPSGMEGPNPETQLPPWTQPAVAQRKWKPGRVLTLRTPDELRVRRKARRQARK
jgi:hypothetical protein